MSERNKKIEVGESPGMNFEVRLGVETTDYPGEGPYLRLALFSRYIKFCLPSWFLRPHREWVDTTKYSWSSPRGGYWDETRREFGIYLFENHFNVVYGPQTDNSSTEKRWSCFLPWAEWRFTRLEFQDDLCLQFAEFDYEKLENRTKRMTAEERREYFFELYEYEKLAKEECPKMYYAVKDFDGEQVDVEAIVVEREWKKGKGWFKWLSLFVPKKQARYLEMDFSKEIGPKKGSWKGGTISCSIVMEDNENHDEAFLRFMKQEKMTDFRWRDKPEKL